MVLVFYSFRFSQFTARLLTMHLNLALIPQPGILMGVVGFFFFCYCFFSIINNKLSKLRFMVFYFVFNNQIWGEKDSCVVNILL